MTRESESELLSFCAAQRGDFRADAWTQFDAVEKREMAVVCLFLAGVDWFGHRPQLEKIGRGLVEQANTSFAQLTSLLSFDCARFSNLLKRRIGHA